MDSMDTVYVGAPEGTSVFGWLDSGTLRLLAAADEEEAAALLMSRHGAKAACALVGRVRGSDFRALASSTA